MGRPPCCDKVGVKKGPWTPEEDIVLVSYIKENGPGNWRAVPTNTGLFRCSKSCRLRWANYLRPGIKRGSFTDHEEKMIIQLQALLGNKWAAIASYLPERTDNDIKNYWNTHLKKKLKKLQAGSDNHSSHMFSTSQSISRGQWERKLQTDIHTAKQALNDALSIEKPSLMPELKTSDGYYSYSTKPSQVCSYASSTENISRLLKGWMKPQVTQIMASSSTSSSEVTVETVSSISIYEDDVAHIKGLHTSILREFRTLETPISENRSGSDLSETFESLYGFDSSNSGFSHFVSPEASHFQGCKPEPCALSPLSMIENWLLDEVREDLTDLSFDETTNLF